MEKIGVYSHAKLLVQDLLINPEYYKRFQMKAIAMYYDPEV